MRVARKQLSTSGRRIRQAVLSQEQRTVGATGPMSPMRRLLFGAIVAVSLHGNRYFCPYGQATDAGAPFTRETVVFGRSVPAPKHSPPAGRTSHQSQSSSLLSRAEIYATATRSGPQQLTPRSWQTSPRECRTIRQLAAWLEQRSIEALQVRDFLHLGLDLPPRTRLPSPYK